MINIISNNTDNNRIRIQVFWSDPVFSGGSDPDMIISKGLIRIHFFLSSVWSCFYLDSVIRIQFSRSSGIGSGVSRGSNPENRIRFTLEGRIRLITTTRMKFGCCQFTCFCWLCLRHSSSVGGTGSSSRWTATDGKIPVKYIIK